MLPRIETRSGIGFWPLAPCADDVDIKDIAHSLSNQCRFTGHTREHYSVAEHCVRVSKLLEEWGCSTEVQLWGLLHDASEAYLVDLPSPLKSHPSFEFYSEVERDLMAVICIAFGLALEEPDEVRHADGVLLATEARDLMAYKHEHWEKLEYAPLAERIEPWGPEVARARFWIRYKVLTAPDTMHTPAPVAVRPGPDDEAAPDTLPSGAVAPAQASPAPTDFDVLLAEWKASRPGGMTAEEKEAQRRSFTYGNVALSNPNATRAMIDAVADGKDTNPKDRIAANKIPLTLCSPIAAAKWALGMFSGLCKYGAWNWRKSGVRSSVYLDAARRHLDAYESGEEVDPVDGTDHRGNVMACMSILMDAEAAGKLTDDRPPIVGIRKVYAECEALMGKLREQYKDKAPRHYTIADTEEGGGR